MQRKAIHVVLRKSKNGQLYGITYVDHNTKCIFNGSTLGKQYNAKGIIERCSSDYFNNERYYYKSVSISSEKKQSLESKDYLKTNPIDILQRVENTNEYIPKQLKQKKKKRIRRSI